MPDPILQVRRLNAHYGDFQALYGVDMQVAEGEVLAIIGANGAGKTTLMRSITGLLVNGPGQIRYRGADIGRLRADEVAALGLAMVPEGRQLFPSLSVRENLMIGGQMGRKGPWNLEAIYKLFPILKERKDQASTSLSGGQQQMLGLAMALVHDPEVLIIDELSLGLAPLVVQQLLEVIDALKSQGQTMIIVEQSLQVALAVADRAIFMEKGQVKFSGPTAELLERDDLARAVFLGGDT